MDIFLATQRGINIDKNIRDLAQGIHIKELKKYSPMCDDKVLSFMQINQIKTIGDFRLLTESRARGFAAKSKQTIYKNNLIKTNYQ